jgi:tetratricopeptide (TPR) repeat protein
MARLRAALREGRTMQALDLAKQVYKAEPSTVNRELLLDTYLARSSQLRAQDKQRDAVTVLQVAAELAGDHPARLGVIAAELAANGEVAQALALVTNIPESPAHAQVLAQAADAAIRREASGRALLPPKLHADFDHVLQAFAQLEAGQDDAARETLQGIGLRSPFLEWKVFLRGLQAHYHGDDTRAIENWQRLNPERLPARLAAPLRFRVDAAYRTAQPPDAQRVLQRQADRLLDQGLLPHLRSIQTALAGHPGLAEAFRLGSQFIPWMRDKAPRLVPALARCYYWAIINGGVPDDVPRYLRLFGPPPDDPACQRLAALASEHVHDLEQAHLYWGDYEKTVADNATAWRAEYAMRVRALIWLHMGKNAAMVPDLDLIPDLPPFLRNHPDRPRPLKPSAEHCFKKSIKLAPELLEAHEALFDYLNVRHDLGKSEAAGRQLLERFPDHVKTLEELADLLMSKEHYSEALDLLERALKQHPLDRRLRNKLGTAHTYNARARAEAGDFGSARTEYQAALALEDRQDNSAVLCKWAACEFKAGDAPRAEELLTQALGAGGTRLAVAFSMLIETIRLKLPRPLKKRFDSEFKEALEEPATGDGAAAVVDTAAAHSAAGVNYLGQKTHEKKILAYVEKAKRADFTEQQLSRVCEGLLLLQSTRLLRAYCQLGERRFPKSAIFTFLEAESYVAKGQQMLYDRWKVQPLLEKAFRLATAMPHDDRRAQLLDKIQERQKILQTLNGASLGMFGNLFNNGAFADAFGDDEDEWDEDESY